MPNKAGREFDFIWEDGSDDRVEWTFEREVAPATLSEPSPAKLAVAKTIYSARRLRDRHAGPHADLFSEPAWDLLLDLYMAHGEKRDVTTARACVAACAPSDTALSCLNMLWERRLISRDESSGEGRNRPLALTIDGIDLVERLLPDTFS